MSTLYDRNIALLKSSGVVYREVEHEVVLTYETAASVRQRFGLTGVESKSLLLRLKDGRYCMFGSVEGKRANFKKIKDLVGSKPSLCTDEELVEQTGCVPKCACPFGHEERIILIIDSAIFNYAKFLYSPGIPERTVEIATADLEKIIAGLPNPVVRYTVNESDIPS
jgi:Ala-tRNA(Pro) deacylase